MRTLDVIPKLPNVAIIKDAKLVSAEMYEAANEPFKLTMNLVVPSSHYRAEQVTAKRGELIHQLAGIEIIDGAGKPIRKISGYIASFTYKGCDDAGVHLELVAVPKLYFMGLGRECEVHQSVSALDLLKNVTKRHGISLGGSPQRNPTIDYAVQYRESDLDFFNRICEQEGISYHFEDSATGGDLKLWDSPGQCEAIASNELSYNPDGRTIAHAKHLIYEWHEQQDVVIGSHLLHDYHYENAYDFNKLSKAVHHEFDGTYNVGAFSDYPGGHTRWGVNTKAGTNYAALSAEQHPSDATSYWGGTTTPAVRPGKTFKLKDHRKPGMNSDYLVTSATHEIKVSNGSSGSGGFEYHCKFGAVRKDSPHRPAVVTSRPSIPGVQPAIVTGKDSADSVNEVYTDDQARVLVRFLWDQRLHDSTRPSSCWVRVAQQWAGDQWGTQFLPRVGTEVLVSFLEGDPDRPVIVGAVYNSKNSPLYPASESHKTGWRSRSTKQGTPDEFNELTFSDKLGHEEVFLQGQKDMNVKIKNDQVHHIGNRLEFHVGGGGKAGGVSIVATREGRVQVTAGMINFNCLTHSTTAIAGITLQAGAGMALSAGAGLAAQAGGAMSLSAAGAMSQQAGAVFALQGKKVKIN